MWLGYRRVRCPGVGYAGRQMLSATDRANGEELLSQKGETGGGALPRMWWLGIRSEREEGGEGRKGSANNSDQHQHTTLALATEDMRVGPVLSWGRVVCLVPTCVPTPTALTLHPF